MILAGGDRQRLRRVAPRAGLKTAACVAYMRLSLTGPGRMDAGKSIPRQGWPTGRDLKEKVDKSC